MSASSEAAAGADRRHISRVELVALLAMLVATVAFSIDAMLPAMPAIGAELVPDNPNSAQLVLSAFIVGMGVGTLFIGPMSDAWGRKPVMLGGAAVYIAGAALAWAAPSIELLILARLMQGLGASGPRVVSLAVIRDLYSGREMARLLSFVMIVFTLFPAFAPLIGSGIIALAGWRAIFLSFVIFSLITVIWLTTRLPEPLPRERRRPLSVTALLAATREMAGIPMVRLSIATQALIFSSLFTSISLIQLVFDRVFDRADEFPLWFFVIGLVAGTSSMVNAFFVMKYGMRQIITLTLTISTILSVAGLIVSLALGTHPAAFAVYIVFLTAMFFQMGLTIGNLNALAMEPLGHIAGLAASVIGAISTVFAGIVASLIAQTFAGTTLPHYLGVMVIQLIALPLVLRMKRLERVKSAA